MDEHRPISISIPIETWIAKRNGIMEGYGHLREGGMRFTAGGEGTLVRRLRTLLLMVRRAVIDPIRST